MLTSVLGVVVVGIALLAAAVWTGKTFLAVIAIAIAVVGLVLVIRGWSRPSDDETSDIDRSADETPLEPDAFEPDVEDDRH